MARKRTQLPQERVYERLRWHSPVGSKRGAWR